MLIKYSAVWFLLIILEGTRSSTFPSIMVTDINPDGTLNATYDCSSSREKEYVVSIWGPDIPEKIHSLTIENCESVVLNISLDEEKKKDDFTSLTVRNVEHCEVTAFDVLGRPVTSARTGLPRIGAFLNLSSLRISVPLFNESCDQLLEGVIQFTNVTVEKLMSKTVGLETSQLKRFSLIGVNVKVVEEDALYFKGHSDSILEVESSVFPSIPENFIACNVTNAIFRKNTWGNLGRGSFLLTAGNFDFSGNAVGTVHEYAFNVSSSSISIRNNSFDFLKRNAFRGISGNEDALNNAVLALFDNVVKKTDEAALKMDKNYLNQLQTENPWESCESLSTNITNDTFYENLIENGQRENRPKSSKENGSVIVRFTNNIFLLWLLAFSFLILLFPAAYIFKLYFCRAVDRVFPVEFMHKRLEDNYT
ncbi:UNVERIFIED_CONTAM: hypothetical protein PYX00_007941 [Menopon gallinae]|uniref:Uncharacterized protein n=1 Tax=Menopon gallinae TaxID=328185 RepID=A0AAW2HKT8_9NEOP